MRILKSNDYLEKLNIEPITLSSLDSLDEYDKEMSKHMFCKKMESYIADRLYEFCENDYLLKGFPSIDFVPMSLSVNPYYGSTGDYTDISVMFSWIGVNFVLKANESPSKYDEDAKKLECFGLNASDYTQIVRDISTKPKLEYRQYDISKSGELKTQLDKLFRGYNKQVVDVTNKGSAFETVTDMMIRIDGLQRLTNSFLNKISEIMFNHWKTAVILVNTKIKFLIDK